MPFSSSSSSGRGGSSLFGIRLGHDVAQGEACARIAGAGVPALMLVLEVLGQRGVLLECLATAQAVHIPCIATACDSHNLGLSGTLLAIERKE